MDKSNLEVIAIVPARGGSKGVPGKNIRLLANKPLITHSITVAKESKLVDRVYVSTDDNEIATVASEYGAEVIDRPSTLATDTASSESALLHTLETLEQEGILPKIVVFLQCTSPIRAKTDIDEAIVQLQKEQADSLLSVSPSHRFLWQEKNGNPESINYNYQQRQRRQEMLPQYMENGSIYIFKPWVLKKLGNRLGGKITLFKMSDNAALEIDSLLDFTIVEQIMLHQNRIGS